MCYNIIINYEGEPMMKLKKITILGTMIIGLMLSGCGGGPEVGADVVVEEFLQDFKNMDYEGMYALTQDGHQYFKDIYLEDNEGNNIIFSSLSENMEYEIIEVDKSFWKKEATVEVKINNIDASAAMGDVITDFLNTYEEYENELDEHDMDQVLNDIVEQRLSDPEAIRKETNTIFNLTQEGNKWVIDSNIMIYDDVTGGYLTYYFQNNFINGLGQ